MVVGCWLLVVGCWLLVVGCWLLVVGCWLVVGANTEAPIVRGIKGWTRKRQPEQVFLKKAFLYLKILSLVSLGMVTTNLGIGGRLAGWQVGRLAGWLVGWLAGWLVGWLAGWLVGWLAGWLVGWLAGWLDQLKPFGWQVSRGERY